MKFAEDWLVLILAYRASLFHSVTAPKSTCLPSTNSLIETSFEPSELKWHEVTPVKITFTFVCLNQISSITIEPHSEIKEHYVYAMEFTESGEVSANHTGEKYRDRMQSQYSVKDDMGMLTLTLNMTRKDIGSYRFIVIRRDQEQDEVRKQIHPEGPRLSFWSENKQVNQSTIDIEDGSLSGDLGTVTCSSTYDAEILGQIAMEVTVIPASVKVKQSELKVSKDKLSRSIQWLMNATTHITCTVTVGPRNFTSTLVYKYQEREKLGGLINVGIVVAVLVSGLITLIVVVVAFRCWKARNKRQTERDTKHEVAMGHEEEPAVITRTEPEEDQASFHTAHSGSEEETQLNRPGVHTGTET